MTAFKLQVPAVKHHSGRQPRLCTFRVWLRPLRALWDRIDRKRIELRAEMHISELPDHLHKDIGFTRGHRLVSDRDKFAFGTRVL